jgi:two-component system chemotaxis sensor kinase CheA
MHLIRNAIDHGIESPEERVKQGKARSGKILLEAKSEGGDVWISVKDDGAGLNKEKIMQRIEKMGLMAKLDQDFSVRDIYNISVNRVFLRKTSERVLRPEWNGYRWKILKQWATRLW